MAKLPTIIRNMQQGQMKRLADGGNVTSFVTGGEVNDEGRVMGSDGQEYLVSAGYQPGDTLGGATLYGGTATGTGGGTTTPDIPTVPGGAGEFPSEVQRDPEGQPTVSALSGILPLKGKK